MSTNNRQISRRHALILLSGLGLTGFSGCCCLRPFPSSEIGNDPKPSDVINPFLRPTVRANPAKPFKYCIDVHAHFFNASDVDVKGYLEGPVAHGQSEPLRQFLKAMAPIVDDLAAFAPDASREYRALVEMMGVPFTTRELLDDTVNKHRDNVAKELFNEMQKRNLGTLYLKLRESQLIQLNRLPIADEKFSYEMIRQAIDPALRRSYVQGFFRNEAQRGVLMDPSGVIEFLGYMLSYRWMTLRTYQKLYSEDEDAFGIDAAFGALLDFDYWLDCPPRSAHEDQVKVQSLLSLLSGGYMLPLVGYNPWTDIKRGGASLDLIKTAVQKFGFIGVKIYPPIGFFPYGNEFNKVNTTKPRPNNLRDLDEKLEALFSWCSQQGVPVMAHTSQSAGRDGPSDEFGGPIGWKALLQRFQNSTPPLINAGHFGGQEPGANHTDNSWPTELAKLMAISPTGDRLYADIGYWPALQWCGQDNTDCEAIKRIKAALRAFGKAADRILFGTDWFMLSVERDPYNYAAQLSQNLNGILPEEQLFYRNAIECFGLNTNGQNGARLKNRLMGLRGGLPSWLADA